MLLRKNFKIYDSRIRKFIHDYKIMDFKISLIIRNDSSEILKFVLS